MTADAEPRFFLDTNILVYRQDHREPLKQRLAIEASEREGLAVVSTQVLQELFVAVQRRLRASPMEAEAMVHAAANYEVVPISRELALQAITRSRTSQLSLWDALIVEAALAAGCTRLLSEDLQAGQRFGELIVENPLFVGVSEGAPAATAPRPRRRRAPR